MRYERTSFVMTCFYCDGPLTLLGQLGRRVHYRCRDCGLDQSTTINEDEWADLEEVI